MNVFKLLEILLAVSLLVACRNPACQQIGVAVSQLGELKPWKYAGDCFFKSSIGDLSSDLACCKIKASRIEQECALDCASAVASEAELYSVPMCSDDPHNPAGSTWLAWLHEGKTVAWCMLLH